MDARGRETGLDQIASEAVIEGSAGDAVGTSARLPEGLGGLHGREVLADIGERPNDGGQCRTRQFPAAAHAALADVAVENSGLVKGDIAGGQIEHLRPASAGEDECEDDGEVPPALDGIGDDPKKLLHLCSRETAWGTGTRLGAFHGIAGIGGKQIQPDEELVERRETADTSADGSGRRFTTREADPMGERKDILSRHLIRRLLGRAEEVSESAVVGVRGAVGAGAVLFLSEEGVRGSLPSQCWNQRRRWAGSEQSTWRTPLGGTSA